MRTLLSLCAITAVALAPLAASADDNGKRQAQKQQRVNCPKAVTQVVKPKNVVTDEDETSRQTVVEKAPKLDPKCDPPLVGTRVVTPLNLATGSGSSAEQDVDSTAPKGSLVTRDVVRGTNKAVGGNTTANQKVIVKRPDPANR